MLSFTSSTSKAASAPFSAPVFQPVRPLPAVQFQVERVNVEHSVPMYAPELIGIVSNLSQPSDNLLHHCYAHLYLKVSSVTILDFLILISNLTSRLHYCLYLPLRLWQSQQDGVCLGSSAVCI